VTSHGVNFSVFSRNAERIELCFYDHADDDQPARVVALDPYKDRLYHYWHTMVDDVGPGRLYAYRAHGPFDPDMGLRFDGTKVLLDPYGRAVAAPSHYRRIDATLPGPNDAHAFKSVIADPSTYDWEDDLPLHRPFSQTVIYEMHVAGFTKHPSSGLPDELRGTYAGLIEKIPYLLDLGITAVELMPVFQFDWQDAPLGRTNYWGYAPISFFAPHAQYSSRSDVLGPLDEFRDMVKAMHRAGIEVILDVVYNHTAEAGSDGPTICFRGLENEGYYLLADGKRDYANYSGTGNTLNANRSTVRRLILDSLRYWVQEMHVDGFRFDLASILSRDQDGTPLPNPPVLWDIESDPVLAGTKLIAEAWDAAGLYQVGAFAGDSWTEWNGKFRDDVRAFTKGDKGTVYSMAQRLLGSPDLYGGAEREAEQSINFVTSHDGFTLNDLVSYNDKHNLANGEMNRDGHDYNLSWNHGIEGPTTELAINRLRQRQVKNLLAATLLSLGAPMLLMGDEIRRTQLGNNNAYSQDNELSWFDWREVERNEGLRRFVRMLIRLRSLRESVRFAPKLTLAELVDQSNIRLHGVRLDNPDFGYDSHSLALSASNFAGDLLMHFMLNAYWEPLEFELPKEPPGADGWRRVVDTHLPSPNDIVMPDVAAPVDDDTYVVRPRTVAILFSGTPQARAGG
jgi:glycogen operon protein